MKKPYVFLAAVWWLMLLWIASQKLPSLIRYMEVRSSFERAEAEVFRIPAGQATTRAPRRDGLTLLFLYEVGGARYNSSRFESLDGPLSQEELERAYPAGKRFQIWYDPKDPENALVDVSFPKSALFGACYLLPFLPPALALSWMAIKQPGRSRAIDQFLSRPPEVPLGIPSWGTLRREGESLVLGYRPKVLLRFAVALILAGPLYTAALGFFGRRSSPVSEEGLLAGTALLVVLSLLIGIYAARRTRSTLYMELPGRTLTVQLAGRTSAIKFEEISRVVVTAEGSLEAGKGIWRRFPALWIVNARGGSTLLHTFPGTYRALEIATKAGRFLAETIGKPLERVGTS